MIESRYRLTSAAENPEGQGDGTLLQIETCVDDPRAVRLTILGVNDTTIAVSLDELSAVVAAIKTHGFINRLAGSANDKTPPSGGAGG